MHPDWNIFDTFVVQSLHGVFKNDASNRSRPMTYYTENPSGIKGLFDEIAYAKCKYSTFFFKTYQNNYVSFLAASVLRMFLHAFNETSFKKGLNYYLNEK